MKAIYQFVGSYATIKHNYLSFYSDLLFGFLFENADLFICHSCLTSLNP